MNKQRRKYISEAMAVLDAILEEASHDQNPDEIIGQDFWIKADEAKNTLDSVRDEEQDYLDNIPENMQGGQRYSESEGAIQNLDTAIENLEAAESDLNVEDFCDYLQQALDALEQIV